jgi:hypothetical protein
MHGNANIGSFENNASPFRGANFLNEPNGPVIGRPSNYAEKRIKRAKE